MHMVHCTGISILGTFTSVWVAPGSHTANFRFKIERPDGSFGWGPVHSESMNSQTVDEYILSWGLKELVIR